MNDALKARKDLPSYDLLVKPFGDSIRALQTATGYEVIRISGTDWNDQKAKDAYALLSVERPLRHKDLRKILEERKDMPNIELFLRPFGGNLSALQESLGLEFTNFDRSKWDVESATQLYRELCNAEGTDKPIGQKRLHEILKSRSDLPGIRTFLKPFEGNIRQMQTSAGYKPLRTLDSKTLGRTRKHNVDL